MKKKLLIFIALFALILSATAQESIIKDVFEQYVEQKVERMKKLICFDDAQALQLQELELVFLIKVNNAEKCFLCRTKKRIKKLSKERDKKLQLILSREQYIKYNAIDNNLINKVPPIQV